MPVHLYGHPADVEGLGRLAAERGIDLYEDAAQAHGASLERPAGRHLRHVRHVQPLPDEEHDLRRGRHGHDGDADVERRLRLLRNQGMEKQYENEIVGFNARMTDMHAAIGRVQLTKVLGWTAQRQAERGVPRREPGGRRDPAGRRRAHATSTTSTRSGCPRTATASPTALREEYNIGTGVYYPIPNHRLPSFNRELDLPETRRRAAEEVLSLPVHPSLSQDDLERIVAAVNAVAKAGA